MVGYWDRLLWCMMDWGLGWLYFWCDISYTLLCNDWRVISRRILFLVIFILVLLLLLLFLLLLAQYPPPNRFQHHICLLITKDISIFIF